MPERAQVGYYVHHHGSGHGMRALAIARHMDCDVTLIGSRLPDADYSSTIKALQLPGDTAPGMHVESFPALHYAPLAVDGLRERMGLLADWMRSAWPCLLVVDVSVEVAMLARLFGVPCVYMRQHGERTDPAHLQAYASASRLLAPYPASMECSQMPDWVLAKTDHCGWVSRYSQQSSAHVAPEHGAVLVITGQGGTAFTVDSLIAIARRCPEDQFRVAGPLPASDLPLPGNLTLLGHLVDPLPELLRAEIVVGSAGDNVVAEVAHMGGRLIAIAEQRPFDEQRLQALQLERLGVALGVLGVPAADQWPALLQRARHLPGRRGWQALLNDNAAADAARIVVGTLHSHFGSS
ncbi:hypothetical protein [Pseudomonas baltica]|uniref:Glycosyl transferase family 28 C-terminal domain-containing protein n=1 Tax=Pseudomonas baltica TaxID=2762576 RepID=A0A7X1KS92_9PSED|nr:hypothetical protein [Pseudomonas baltica]MBC2677368.1 hypothetical protein [Pseudomonas baltica]